VDKELDSIISPWYRINVYQTTNRIQNGSGRTPTGFFFLCYNISRDWRVLPVGQDVV